MSLLDDKACRSIELLKEFYTWKSADGQDEEQDGATIFAIIMSWIKPHYKVDMFQEIKDLKEVTLKQFNNNLVDYFDKIQEGKISIDEKDPQAYSDDAFV